MTSVKRGIISLLLFCVALFQVTPVYALQFDLFAPQGALSRGQNVDFTVSIDTEGATVKNTSVGMSYQTQYLQYVKTTTGNTVDQVEAVETEKGTLVLTGTDTAGFKGSGNFATVTFTIIADSPGASDLCTLFTPTAATPASTQPTTAPQPTATPAMCVPQQTACSCQGTAPCSSNLCSGGMCSGAVCTSCLPAPTSLPATGTPQKTAVFAALGISFVAFFVGSNLFSRKLGSGR